MTSAAWVIAGEYMKTRVLIGIAAVAAAALASPQVAPSSAQGVEATPPNVVIIITDDQPQGTMDAMPQTQRLLFDQGVEFRNGIIPTSLCCPSRAALLSGKLAHTTGVYTNVSGDFGGWNAFRPYETQTLATALNAMGYRTGLFGKYLNGWGGRTVPPGWDAFRSFNKMKYYDYTLKGIGPAVTYGSSPSDYSTDVIANLAVNFVQSDEPVFAYIAPYAPHQPATPAPRHDGTWPLVPASEVPAFNEADVSDKPAWAQRAKVSASTQRNLLTNQHEALRAVDEMVARLVNALAGEDTIFVYLSDNGLMNGSHRFYGKDVPYDRSARVPMAISWPGHLTPGVSQRITTNVDLTQTILDAAGAQLPGDGISVFDGDRTETLLEQMARESSTANVGHPAYCGVRTERYMFVEYDDDAGSELYDYVVDPNELTNVTNSPSYQDVRAELRSLAQQLCSPVPPGFNW